MPPETAPPVRLGYVAHFKRITGLDRAIFFTIIARSWSTLAGAVNVLLIARFLSQTEQGYYYTFLSLVAIQVVFELGFSFVILQMAAHERARLTTFQADKVEGDMSAYARLASILQQAVRWYTRLAFAMVATLLVVGIRFFSTHNRTGETIHWLLPWCLDAIAAALVFQIDPIISFLEGCGWVVGVAKMRFFQAAAASLIAWMCLLLHHGLFAPAATIGAQALVGLSYLVFVHGKLLRGLLSVPKGPHYVSWRQEIWPFQWRIAVSWGSNYFVYQLFTPVLFAFSGPVVAGRMGMSLSIGTSISNVALAWISTKAAPFGSLVAKKQIGALNRLFRKTLIQSTAMLFICEVAGLSVLAGISHFLPKFADRFLPLPWFAVLLLTILMGHIVICQAYYLRAHKQEPFLWYWIWIALFSAISVYWTGKHWGIAGVTLSYFVCGGVLRLIAATFIFFRKKRLWHGEAIEDVAAIIGK